MPASRPAGLFVTCAAFGLIACSATADRSAGERSFEQSCGSCHRVDTLPGSLATDLADPVKKSELDRFLARHHAAEPAVRGEIVEYLATQGR